MKGATLLLVSALLAPASPALAQQTKVIEPVSGAFSNVCHLSTRREKVFGGSWNNGSAVLYRGRYLITAAHNVFSTSTSRLEELNVACGKAEPSEAEHISVDVSQIRTASGYRFSFPKRFHRDFAVIRLPVPITTQKPIELFSGARPSGPVAVELAGFPGRKKDEGGMDGWTMFRGSGIAEADDDARRPYLWYDFESEKGNSGGPAWTMAGETPLLIGIHVGNRRARLVDPDFVEEVNAMILDLEVEAGSPQ